MFSRPRHRLRVFPRLAPVACFPSYDNGCMFLRAWHQLHVFPRLALVACFPALGTSYMFSRAWHQLHVFPRFAPIPCFPALGAGYMFSRAFDSVWMFFCAPHWLRAFSLARNKLHFLFGKKNYLRVLKFYTMLLSNVLFLLTTCFSLIESVFFSSHKNTTDSLEPVPVESSVKEITLPMDRVITELSPQQRLAVYEHVMQVCN